VRLTASTASSATIAWDAHADLESGLANYRIYRNGLRRYDYCTATGSSVAQHWVYSGMNPETFKATFTDNNLTQATLYAYQVTTINHAGLESSLSAPLSVIDGKVDTKGTRQCLTSARLRPEAKRIAIFAGGGRGEMRRAGNAALQGARVYTIAGKPALKDEKGVLIRQSCR
jgi:hypothetical protein